MASGQANQSEASKCEWDVPPAPAPTPPLVTRRQPKFFEPTKVYKRKQPSKPTEEPTYLCQLYGVNMYWWERESRIPRHLIDEWIQESRLHAVKEKLERYKFNSLYTQTSVDHHEYHKTRNDSVTSESPPSQGNFADFFRGKPGESTSTYNTDERPSRVYFAPPGMIKQYQEKMAREGKPCTVYFIPLPQDQRRPEELAKLKRAREQTQNASKCISASQQARVQVQLGQLPIPNKQSEEQIKSNELQAKSKKPNSKEQEILKQLKITMKLSEEPKCEQSKPASSLDGKLAKEPPLGKLVNGSQLGKHAGGRFMQTPPISRLPAPPKDWL